MKTITVDGCSICQLKCPQCPVTQMGYKNTIGKGYLKSEDFQKLITANPRSKHVEFDNFGELFLNPDLEDILLIAQKNKIMVSCAGGVNLNTVSERILELLVKTRFQYLNVSIDGASQETYSKYRVGGSYEKVIENINLINYYKQELGTPYPKLQWQFIVFGHNEHELQKAQRLALDHSMRFFPKMNWNSEYSPIKYPETVKEQTGWDVITREEYERKHGVSYVRPTCYQLWSSPRQSWDLTCTGCCWNIWARFDKYTIDYAKQDLLGVIKDRFDIPLPPCKSCEIYYKIVESGLFLSKPEVLYHTVKTRMTTDAKYLLWRNDL